MNFYAEKLERSFVRLVVKKVIATMGATLPNSPDDSLKDFAIRVWPDKDEKRALEKIKLLTAGYPTSVKGKRAGRPQRLVFGDAQRMAYVLEVPLAYLITLAEENIKREEKGLDPY